jgi:diguanylate cyclase (GGDEF)-like protein/PAS domain S-box-containing protein
MSRVHLLLVEDDLTDQMSFQRFVKREQLPYDYHIANSIAEAIEVLQFMQFDLVLADHALGDGTAFDLFPHIPTNTPVVFVTGCGGEDIAVKAMKSGAADYLTKDLNGDYLKLLPPTIDSVIKAKTIEKELEVYKQLLEEMVEIRTEQLRQEINERMRIEQQLIEDKERAQTTLKSIGDAVITTDVQGIIEFINPIAESLTGWQQEQAQSQPIDKVFKIVYADSHKPAVSPIYRCIAKNKIVALEEDILLISRSGDEYFIQISVAPIHDITGKVQGVVLVFSNVTQARKLNQELAYQATHDPLTGLVNRRVFEQRLNRVLESRRISGGSHIFCYLDLDKFKIVNDTCGHTAGDELLKQVTSILRNKVRLRDTLARLGGDEFGILMEHCSLDRAEFLANTLCEAIANFRFHWENKSFQIGVSIGVIEISDRFNNLNDLLMAADASCYAAKDAGRSRVHVYSDSNQNDAKLSQGQVHWEDRLTLALEEKQFKLFKQPIKNVCSTIEGECYEILVRLEDENKTLIPPGAFLPAAERYSLMPKLDQYIISNTFAFFAYNPERLQKLAMCTLNLSGYTLTSEGLVDFIINNLTQYKLPAHKFCFEITETAAISNLNFVTGLIKSLKEHGFLFALDNFGSGLSSFAYLKNLPVDFLKIDGILIKDICDDPVNFAMSKAINEIGHVMNKQTIAEFVETADIYDKLKDVGIDFVQGYWIKEPYPLEDN